MPQLDKVTFLSQFFWLCVFFFGFYIFQLKYFLPEMSRILKFRKKRLSESSGFNLKEENNSVRNSASTLLENLLLNSKNVFKTSFSKSDNWFSDYAQNLNQKAFRKGNLQYLQSIADKSLSKSFAIVALNNNFSEKILSTRILSRFLKIPESSLSLKSANYANLDEKTKSDSSKQNTVSSSDDSNGSQLKSKKKKAPKNLQFKDFSISAKNSQKKIDNEEKTRNGEKNKKDNRNKVSKKKN